MISIDQLKNRYSVTNLWPIPVARSQDFTPFNYSGGENPVISDNNGGVLIDTTAISEVQNMCIKTKNDNIMIQPGKYVFSAYLATTGTFDAQDAVAALFSYELGNFVVRIAPSDFNAGITSKTFTITRPISVSLQYKVPPAAKTTAYGCGVYSLQDWNKLKSLGINWFNPIDKTYAKISQFASYWTEAANQSTSTLSKDGKTVATNLFQNPNLLAQYLTPRNYSGGAVPIDIGNYGDKNIGVPDNVSVVFHDPNSGVQNSCLATNIDIQPPAGNYHIHAEINPYGNFPANGADFALNFAPFVGIRKEKVPYDSIWTVLDADFTANGNDHNHIEFKVPGGGWARWRRVGIYKAEDWAAMQSLGIDWFSGDTYSNLSSLHDIASDADFFGVANASLSAMIIDKQKIKNRSINEVPLSTIGTVSANVSASDTNDGLLLINNAPGDNYIEFSMSVKTNTKYHVCANLVRADNIPVGNGPLMCYEIDSKNNYILHTAIGGPGAGFKEGSFTTGNDIKSSFIRLYANQYAVGSTAIWKNIGLYEEQDWQAIQSIGIQYFDGSTNLLSDN